jgi:hypothetical protein
MNNQLPANRVETELNQWRSREDRFSKLFSFDLSSNRALLKEKLHYYDRVAAKYKGTPDVDERFALSVLNQERKRIEKQLYPNLLIRLLRRLLVAPIREQIIIRQDARQAEQNNQLLHIQMRRASFTGLSAKVEEQIKQGHQQFSVPVSYYINDKERLDHQLSFAKDQSGRYHLEGYKTNLHNEAKPSETRQQYFSMKTGYSIDTTEAYNLLAGRAIQKEGKWVQLDLNDKDPQGNFRLKEFHSDYRTIKSETEEKINRMEAKLTATASPSINIEPLLDMAITNISQLDTLYEQGTVIQQRKIIGSMFPEKLTFDGFQYRTTRVNEALRLMLLFDKTLRGKKNGTNQLFSDLSQDVTTMGFEPIRLAAPPPQDGESTNFSTWPVAGKLFKQKKLSCWLNFL